MSVRSRSPMRNATSRWHPRHGSPLLAHGQNYSSSKGDAGAEFSSRVLLAGARQQHQINAVGWKCYSRGILDCYSSVHLLDGQGNYQGTSGCGVTEGTSCFHGTWVSIWTMMKSVMPSYCSPIRLLAMQSPPRQAAKLGRVTNYHKMHASSSNWLSSRQEQWGRAS